MASLKDIKRRISAVRGTQKVTRAMKLIAAARLKRAQRAAHDARAYSSEMHKTSMSISRRLGARAPVLWRRPTEIGCIDLVIVTSDRGMCGGFNENLLRAMDEEILNASEHNIATKLFVIGKKGVKYTKTRGHDIGEVPADVGSGELPLWLAGELIERMKKKLSAGSNIVFNKISGSAHYELATWNLLPIYKQGNSSERNLEYLYEPGREEVLEAICIESIVSTITSALLESRAAELAARMTAMDSATKNAEDMISHLTFVYNRRRQESITSELIDIVGGAEALR